MQQQLLVLLIGPQSHVTCWAVCSSCQLPVELEQLPT